MTEDKGFDEDGIVSGEDSSEGPEANVSGPEPQVADADGTGELTVEDILSAGQTEEAASGEAAIADAENDLLDDLKRLQAEYANYRRRTEEQREFEIQRAKGEAAKGLLPVLDDLARAEQHGDLVDGTPFAVIAEKVRSVVERLGVVAFGEAGVEFDPQQHEAIFQQPTAGVERTTVLDVVEVGYRLGDVELRPAKVVVAVPEG